VQRGFDPLETDADADGFEDQSELRVGTDPADPDSDNDGTLDGEETYTVSVSGNGSSVEVTAQGDVTDNISIQRDRGNILVDRISAVVSPITDVNVSTDFEDAKLTLHYDEDQVEDESNVSIYRYNESQGTFVKVKSFVNQSNDTVTAEVNRFSEFAALDEDVWKQKRGRQVPSGVNNTSSPQVLAYLPQRNNFAYGAITLQDASLDESVDNIIGSDGVDSQGNGVPPAGSAFGAGRTCGDDEVYRLNDGTIDFNLDTCGADDGFFFGYNIIGENSSIEVTYRSTNTGIVIDGQQIPTNTTINLSSEGTSFTDTDKDGLIDSIENQTIPLGNGLAVETQYDDRDSDNDGLSDGRELNLKQKNKAGYKAVSDPSNPDTDSDGIPDFHEVEAVSCLDPWDSDTDDDGTPDGEDRDPCNVLETKAEDSAPPHVKSGWAVRGAVLGEIGMPGGFMGPNGAVPGHTTWREIESIPYFGGHLVSGFIVVGDIRDAAADIHQQDWVGSFINGIGVVPVAGDTAKITGSIGDYVKYAPTSKVDDAFRFTNGMLARHFPGRFTEPVWMAFGKGDAYKKLANEGLSNSKIASITSDTLPTPFRVNDIADVTKQGDDVFIWLSGESLTNSDEALNILRSGDELTIGSMEAFVATSSKKILLTLKPDKQDALGILWSVQSYQSDIWNHNR